MIPTPDNDLIREEADPKSIEQDVYLMNAQMIATQ